MDTDRIRTRSLLDVCLLCSLPLFLIGVHVVTTDTTRTALSFRLTDPSVLNAWTAAFVHASWTHLEANLVAYLLAIFTAYLLYAKWERERVMLGVVAVLLLTTPPVQSLIDYAVLTVYLDVGASDAHTKGFSGVVGAYIGLLIASIEGYITHRTNPVVGTNVLFIVLFLAASVVLAVYPPTGYLLVGAVGLLLVGVTATTYRIVTEGLQEYGELRTGIKTGRWEILLVGTSILVALLLVATSFPANPGADGTTANLLAHLTGIVYGFLVTRALLRIP